MDYLIHHLLRTSAYRTPEKEALVHNNERLSYHEVARRVGGLAVGLQQAGLQRGDRFGIYLDPSVPQVLSIFAVHRRREFSFQSINCFSRIKSPILRMTVACEG